MGYLRVRLLKLSPSQSLVQSDLPATSGFLPGLTCQRGKGHNTCRPLCTERRSENTHSTSSGSGTCGSCNPYYAAGMRSLPAHQSNMVSQGMNVVAQPTFMMQVSGMLRFASCLSHACRLIASMLGALHEGIMTPCTSIQQLDECNSSVATLASVNC